MLCGCRVTNERGHGGAEGWQWGVTDSLHTEEETRGSHWDLDDPGAMLYVVLRISQSIAAVCTVLHLVVVVVVPSGRRGYASAFELTLFVVVDQNMLNPTSMTTDNNGYLATMDNEGYLSKDDGIQPQRKSSIDQVRLARLFIDQRRGEKGVTLVRR